MQTIAAQYEHLNAQQTKIMTLRSFLQSNHLNIKSCIIMSATKEILRRIEMLFKEETNKYNIFEEFNI